MMINARKLFPISSASNSVSVALLILRVVFGFMLMTHGWAKLTNFDAMADNFLWGKLGLSLTVFAEFFCSLAVIFGFMFRAAIIPPLFTMFMAFFFVHHAQLVGEGNGEMALLYLAAFVALLIAGPGTFSTDSWIGKELKRRR